ncbi:MAG: hypothetical protein CMP77_08485 [Flavobacterium sp.]|nr:hypothetical protein [Flavobacterium sp.]
MYNQNSKAMAKNLLLLFLILPVLCAAQTITLKGKVTDPDDIPLESATVYLITVADSTVIDYTLSDSEGKWEIKTREKDAATDLRISFISFSDHKERLEQLKGDKDFGTVKLKEMPTELNEVIVERDVPPIRVKKDTLEFNASSFKVRPDANVEALLKKLPGVEIDANGNITLNGKSVSKILVNGKPFFDENGQIALQNLPADIIDKVQVTDTKTAKEELTKQDASGQLSTINLTIKKGKNKGTFGKATAGYGTNERYEGSMMANFFRDETKISLVGSSNNINSSGLDFGGGMGSTRMSYRMGGMGMGMMQYTGATGITQSGTTGINYSDELIKGFDSTVSYFYNTSDSENENRTNQVTFITPGPGEDAETERSITTNSGSISNSERQSHNVNSRFRIEIDSTSSVHFDPRFSSSQSKTRARSSQTAVDQDGELLNESAGSTFNDSDSNDFNGSLVYNKVINKRKSFIAVSMQGNRNINKSADFNRSQTAFYNQDVDGDGEPDIVTDNRNQVQYNRQERGNYAIETEYSEYVTDSLQLNTSLQYNHQSNVADRDGFNFDEASGGFTNRNDSISNYQYSENNAFTPKLGLTWKRKKFRVNLSGGPAFTRLYNEGGYMSLNYNITKNYIVPDLQGSMFYNITKSKTVSFNYNYNVNLPDARQLLPIQDLSNPLSTQVGNPDLNPSANHGIALNLQSYDMAGRSGLYLMGSFNYIENSIVSNTVIDDSGKSTTSYTNISGNYSTRISVNWNKSYKREASSIMVGLGVSTGLNHNRGFTNGSLYEADQLSLVPRLSINWDYGELFSASTWYNYNYNSTNYTNYTIDRTSFGSHSLNLNTTSYWPKNFVFANDFNFTYNPRLGAGFRKSSYLWNMSLGYNIIENKLMMRLRVYDLLKQNVGTQRTVSATSITDQQNTVLGRYAMFSLTYSFNHFVKNSNK